MDIHKWIFNPQANPNIYASNSISFAFLTVVSLLFYLSTDMAILHTPHTERNNTQILEIPILNPSTSS